MPSANFTVHTDDETVVSSHVKTSGAIHATHWIEVKFDDNELVIFGSKDKLVAFALDLASKVVNHSWVDESF